MKIPGRERFIEKFLPGFQKGPRRGHSVDPSTRNFSLSEDQPSALHITLGTVGVKIPGKNYFFDTFYW